MIYGKDIKPGVYDGFGGAGGCISYVVGALNISYLQNNFGVNLLEEERPCMFFTADNLIGARDSVNMFIYSPDSQQESSTNWRKVSSALPPVLMRRLSGT